MQLPLLVPTAPPHPCPDTPRNPRVQGPGEGAQREASFSQAMDGALATPGTGTMPPAVMPVSIEEKADDGGTGIPATANIVPGLGLSLFIPSVAPPPATAPVLLTDAGSAAEATAVAGISPSTVPAAGTALLSAEALVSGQPTRAVAVSAGGKAAAPAAGAETWKAAAGSVRRTTDQAALTPDQGTRMDTHLWPDPTGLATPPQNPVQSVAVQPAPAAGPAPLTYPERLTPQLAGPLFTLATAGPGQHVLTLKVTPESLGPLTVRAHIDGAGVRIELFAPGDAGREAVRAILPELRRGLTESGLGAALNLSQYSAPADPNPGGPGHHAGHRAPGQHGEPRQQGRPAQHRWAVTEATGPTPRPAVVLPGSRPGMLDVLA